LQLINRKLWDLYDIQFPVEKEKVFIHGMNGSGKTHTLLHLKSYFEESGENVLYFPDERVFLLDPEECNKIIRKHGGLRAMFGMKEGFIGEHEIDPKQLHLEREYGTYIRRGKVQLINFFCSIMMLEKESVVIIDEPERNLHLMSQNSLISDLLKLRNVKKIIVATHSPSIISHSMQDAFNVESFFVENTKIEIER